MPDRGGGPFRFSLVVYNYQEMCSSSVGRLLRTPLWAGCAALVAFALLSPAFGPTLDHHFAERQYSHAHIYLGPPGVDHVHPFETSHIHSQPRDEARGATGDQSQVHMVPRGIVYLTSHDGMGAELAVPFMPTQQAAAIFPNPDSFFFTFAHHDNILSEALVAPPKKPPRV